MQAEPSKNPQPWYRHRGGGGAVVKAPYFYPGDRGYDVSPPYIDFSVFQNFFAPDFNIWPLLLGSSRFKRVVYLFFDQLNFHSGFQGKMMASSGGGTTKIVPLSDMPPYVKFIKSFYHNL
jgi:hypothetical protein